MNWNVDWNVQSKEKGRFKVKSFFFPLSNLVAYLGQLMLLGNNSLQCNNAFSTFSKSFHPFIPVDINDHIEL